jgi:HK97 family phage prohead protease
MEMKRTEIVDDVKQVDDVERSIVHIITNETPDRSGDVVRASGMDDESFGKNPVVMFGHDYATFPIGRSMWRKRTERGGVKGILAKTQFADTPEGNTAFKLWKGGFLNAASVGFIGKESDVRKDEDGRYLGREFKKWELLEYSIVPVPANAGALRLSIDKGELPTALVKAIKPWLVERDVCELNECKKGMGGMPDEMAELKKRITDVSAAVEYFAKNMKAPDFAPQFKELRDLIALASPVDYSAQIKELRDQLLEIATRPDPQQKDYTPEIAGLREAVAKLNEVNKPYVIEPLDYTERFVALQRSIECINIPLPPVIQVPDYMPLLKELKADIESLKTKPPKQVEISLDEIADLVRREVSRAKGKVTI